MSVSASICNFQNFLFSSEERPVRGCGGRLESIIHIYDPFSSGRWAAQADTQQNIFVRTKGGSGAEKEQEQKEQQKWKEQEEEEEHIIIRSVVGRFDLK